MVQSDILYQVNKFLEIDDYHYNNITGGSVLVYIVSKLDNEILNTLYNTISILAPDSKIITNINDLEHNNTKLIVYVGYYKDINNLYGKHIVFTLNEKIKYKYLNSSLDGKYSGWICEVGNNVGLYTLIYDKLRHNSSTYTNEQLSIIANIYHNNSVKNLHIIYPDISHCHSNMER